MNILLSWLNSAYSTVLPFVILLGFLIFVHEMGHFLVAKWCGVRVEVFSLGFGKKLLKFKRGDTTYALSLIPLGGYVKMFGDEIGTEVSSDEKRFAFTHKKLWQRIAIVLAGPVMNFLFAVLIFSVIAIMGEEFRKPVLGDIQEGTAAYQAGFRSGDEVTLVGGEKVSTWEEMQDRMTERATQETEFTISREGGVQSLKLKAQPQLRPNNNPISTKSNVGDVDGLTNQSLAAMIGVVPGSPAEAAGLKTGDRILMINNQEIKYFRELENHFVSAQGQEVSVQVERLDGNKSVEDRPVLTQNLKIKLGSLASLGAFGVESGELYLAKILEKSPAAVAGLQEGDRVIQVNQKKPLRWEDVLNTVKSYDGTAPLDVLVQRRDQVLKFQMTPNLNTFMNPQGAEEKRFTIGIMPWVQSAMPATKLVVTHNPFSALYRGLEHTGDVTAMMAISFLRMFEGRISAKNIGGVLSIGAAAKQTFHDGIDHFLQLMALISVNLFILNLLPIPVLDGGHLLFYSIEGLKGTPLSMRKMEIAQQIGLVLLMSLMAFSLFNDFGRLGLW